jgi:hypothetical protein
MKRVMQICIVVVILAGPVAMANIITVPDSWSSQGWWVSTGLVLNAGDVIHVVATGTWNPWVGQTDYCGAEGSSFEWSDQFLNAYGVGAGGGGVGYLQNFGALIGFVGSTPPLIGSYLGMTTQERLNQINSMVLMGSNVCVTSPASGMLWLGMNDDAYSGNCQDNAGALTVTVTPEPATLLLLGLGGLALLRKRRA